VTLRARWVSLRARWVTLRARWVTLRGCWVTLRGVRNSYATKTLGCEPTLRPEPTNSPLGCRLMRRGAADSISLSLSLSGGGGGGGVRGASTGRRREYAALQHGTSRRRHAGACASMGRWEPFASSQLCALAPQSISALPPPLSLTTSLPGAGAHARQARGVAAIGDPVLHGAGAGLVRTVSVRRVRAARVQPPRNNEWQPPHQTGLARRRRREVCVVCVCVCERERERERERGLLSLWVSCHA
jgi:hypothetical protein